jgi:cellulose synthase/poly-beta-1,6-N-acetylglucosamine synthase-like glycosyltransferase
MALERLINYRGWKVACDEQHGSVREAEEIGSMIKDSTGDVIVTKSTDSKALERSSASLRISVAMCTYNGEEYLQEQLDSILAQERLPEEVVVCDDDSSDSTRDILASFAASAPFRVRTEHNLPRMGSTSNFEKAVRLCTG